MSGLILAQGRGLALVGRRRVRACYAEGQHWLVPLPACSFGSIALQFCYFRDSRLRLSRIGIADEMRGGRAATALAQTALDALQHQHKEKRNGGGDYIASAGSIRNLGLDVAPC